MSEACRLLRATAECKEPQREGECEHERALELRERRPRELGPAGRRTILSSPSPSKVRAKIGLGEGDTELAVRFSTLKLALVPPRLGLPSMTEGSRVPPTASSNSGLDTIKASRPVVLSALGVQEPARA